MAAPHLGQSAVPGGTSTRQREHAGNRPTSFCCDGRADTGYRSNGVRPVRVEPVSRMASLLVATRQSRAHSARWSADCRRAYTSGMMVVMQNG
jgi:hypothetical protein